MKTASSLPIRHELLLLGGGHSHVTVIRHFGMRPLPGVRLTVVSRDVHTPYSGMLPGLIAGHYTIDDCHIDLRALCAANGARLVHASACGIDRHARRVLLEGRAPLAYDWLSIDTGSQPALDAIPGAAAHGIAVKPIDRFLQHWLGTLEQLRQHPRPFHLLVVGGGAAGVEVSLACAHRLRATLAGSGASGTVSLAAASAGLLETHNRCVQRNFVRALAAREVRLRLGARVVAADAAGVALADGTRLDADLVVWAIHAGAPAWPRTAGFDCDAGGFIRVESTLRAHGEERVFACGDIAALPQPVAKSGVYAVREGPVLAANLAAAIAGRKLRPYHPQRRFLALLTTGRRHAVASRGPLYAAGDWVWRWKDRIDRAFMERFRVEPLAPPEAGDEPVMRCGGCAAKVGSTLLEGAVRPLSPIAVPGVVHGLEAAEDAAVIAPPPGAQLVQSIDYFRTFTDDPWLLGRIAAVHALGDLYAMGATPHSALAVATVPHAAPAVMQETLAQLMQGAQATLIAEGVALVGGHSNEGAELAFGLAVNGFAGDGTLLLKGGLRPGHALLLTKALGTGVLFAADAAAAAEGRWIDAAFTAMQQGHAPALAVLRAHGVAACTDVTGFGLLGHLREMLVASLCGARLDLGALPALPGARECLARGYRSSLDAGNRAHLDCLATDPDVLDPVALALVLDPQTAGGLLAAIPAERAAACLEALHAAGYPAAARIGEVDAALSPGRVQPG
jgi:selenide,water dikinase